MDKLDCLRGLEPVSLRLGCSGGRWDILILLCGGGQCSTHVLEGTAEEVHQGSNLIESAKLP